MENKPENTDDLKASNEVLKLKLELEHGMQMYHSNGVDPELEHQWLKYIYEHEQLYSRSSRIKVYDYIGRPAFIPIEKLEREQITDELERLLTIMKERTVQLDCICEYDDSIIYRFITTELFEVEMDNVRMPGLVNHFTYEEFHMNDKYELEKIGVDLIKSIYNHEWRPEYDSIWVGSTVKCNGVNHDFHGFSSVITAFQHRHSFLEIKHLHVHEIAIYESSREGHVQASLAYLSRLHSEDQELVEGECTISFKQEDDDNWRISDILMPGLMSLI